MKIPIIFCILIACLLTCAGCTQTLVPPAKGGVDQNLILMPKESAPTTSQELVAFVETAFEYTKTNGRDAALSEFNNRNGRFIKNDLYIFAYENNGTCLALPYQPELIGTNRFNNEDANRVKYIQQMAGTARTGSGFTQYLYPNPSHNMAIEPKLSYVMKVDDNWFIGAGTYGAVKEPGFILSSEVKDGLKTYVKTAADYARLNGKDRAIRQFNDKNSSFVRGSLYIYAFDYNGTCLALPHQPNLVGTDLSALQDSFGVNYTRVEIDLARNGGGWIYYHYPNPANNFTVEPKVSYIAPVDSTWWIGAGVYPSDENMVARDLALNTGNDQVMANNLSSLKKSVNTTLGEIDNGVAHAAQELTVTGLTGAGADSVLFNLTKISPAVIDAITLHPDGTIVAVSPGEYNRIIGLSIGNQTHIRKLFSLRKPVISQIIPTVEGVNATAMAYPVFFPDGTVAGGVSLLVKPDLLLEQPVKRSLEGTAYAATILETDGRSLYDTDPRQVGKIVFEDPLYARYPDLVAIVHRIVTDPRGTGRYEFLLDGWYVSVKKELLWDTVAFHGTEWRIILIKIIPN